LLLKHPPPLADSFGTELVPKKGSQSIYEKEAPKSVSRKKANVLL
jgi:hypothetical protein